MRCSTLFTNFGTTQILWTLGLGLAGSLAVGVWLAVANPEGPTTAELRDVAKMAWRMPPLSELPKAKLSKLNEFWLVILRIYLVGAVLLVIFKVTSLALHKT